MATDSPGDGPAKTTRSKGAIATSSGPNLSLNREELLKNVSSQVKSVETARKFLETKGYVIIGEVFTPASLSTTLLHLSQATGPTAKDVKHTIDGMQAVAFLLEHAHATEVIDTIAAAVLDKLSSPLDRLSATAEEITTATGTLATTPPGPPPAITYAGIVGSRLPPAHATMIARSDAKNRQVMVDKAPGALTNDLENLSEVVLVEKARVALGLMGEAAEGAPPGTAFLGAKKLRNGGVIYEMNSAASADWMKTTNVMTQFLTHFGGTSVIKNRVYSVVVEYVPVTFDPWRKT